MISSNRSIPRVATTLLVLGGCGDSEPSLEALAASTCASRERCEPYEFDLVYASLEECVVDEHAELVAWYDATASGYGEACATAYRDYFDCWASHYERTCDEYAIAEACAQALDRTFDTCGFSI